MKLCEMAIYQTENPRVPSSILGLGTTDIKGFGVLLKPFFILGLFCPHIVPTVEG